LRPREQGGIDKEGAIGEVDMRVGVMKVEAGRNQAVFEGEDGLD
jgi:hypothetical protein